ncbi:DegV domain-containing protein [Clostridium acetireducens DSM 10703]|uniref:DegV domain-containing protein n=1 Tax=Clostridium acetireducens DSM 10703 TaxID=1121290 RepID=A0A1E8F0K9_9CLOT|nr:DegV family protein [Clostridium acetireducens]OFI06966.1 DegV domain-containing protein [Clostridium acetireducens DSM 10703]
MNKIALITDSTADLNEEIIKKYDVKILPFRIIYKDKEYKDSIEITPKEVYKSLEREVPTSSLPSMKDMDNLFSSLEKDGYTHAIAVTLSSGLSGIYNALKLISDNHPKIISHIIDSKSISCGEGVIVETCGKLIEKGKNFEQIINAVPNFMKRMHIFFVVGTLEYLKKGGRIGKIYGTIGEILNIKPIVSIDKEDGKYYTYSKVRGRKQSLKKLIDIAKDILKTKKCKVYLREGNAYDDTKKVYDELIKLPNVTSIDFNGNISPVSGVHSGPGLVGMGLLEEE